jgi:hypothetical protein
MSTTFRVVIKGVRDGFTKEQVVGQLALLFKVTEEQILSKLDALPFVAKSGINFQATEKYKATLEQRGCVCSIEMEMEPASPPVPTAEPGPVPLVKRDDITICQQCGLQMSVTDTFCGNCGAKQSTETTKTTEENSNQNLTKCDTCNKDISIFAAICPGCGAPNNWIHPHIKQFVSMTDQIVLQEQVTFHSNKTEIWGETKEGVLSWWPLIAAIILTLIVIGASGFPGFIVAPVAYYYYVMKPEIKQKKFFKANVQTGAWESSGDNFWEPVRAILRTLGS